MDQLDSVREEAQKQVQDIASQLHSKSSLLSEKEKELAELQRRLEEEVQEMNQLLTCNKIEHENFQKVSGPIGLLYVCMNNV